MTANRDTLREGMARAEIKAKFGPEAVDLIFDPPVAATDKQRTLFHARAEEARRHADQALTFLAPILDKADSADRLQDSLERAEKRAGRANARADIAERARGYQRSRADGAEESRDSARCSFEAQRRRAEAAEDRADRLSAEVEALRAELSDLKATPVVAEDLGVWTAKVGDRVLYRGYNEGRARSYAAEASLHRTALARAALNHRKEGEDA